MRQDLTFGLWVRYGHSGIPCMPHQSHACCRVKVTKKEKKKDKKAKAAAVEEAVTTAVAVVDKKDKVRLLCLLGCKTRSSLLTVNINMLPSG